MTENNEQLPEQARGFSWVDIKHYLNQTLMLDMKKNEHVPEEAREWFSGLTKITDGLIKEERKHPPELDKSLPVYKQDIIRKILTALSWGSSRFLVQNYYLSQDQKLPDNEIVHKQALNLTGLVVNTDNIYSSYRYKTTEPGLFMLDLFEFIYVNNLAPHIFTVFERFNHDELHTCGALFFAFRENWTGTQFSNVDIADVKGRIKSLPVDEFRPHQLVPIDSVSIDEE